MKLFIDFLKSSTHIHEHSSYEEKLLFLEFSKIYLPIKVVIMGFKREVTEIPYKKFNFEKFVTESTYFELNGFKRKKALWNRQYSAHKKNLKSLKALARTSGRLGDTFSESDIFNKFIELYEDAMKNELYELDMAYKKKSKSSVQDLVSIALDGHRLFITPNNRNTKNIVNLVMGTVEADLNIHKMKLKCLNLKTKNDIREKMTHAKINTLKNKVKKIIENMQFKDYKKERALYLKTLEKKVQKKELPTSTKDVDFLTEMAKRIDQKVQRFYEEQLRTWKNQ